MEPDAGLRPRLRVYRVGISEDRRREILWHVWVTVRNDLRSVEIYLDKDAEKPVRTAPIHQVSIDWGFGALDEPEGWHP